MISGYGRVRAEGYSHTLKALEKDIDTLRSDLKSLSKSIKGGAKEHYADMARWFQEATKDLKARERLGDAMQSVKESSRIAATKTGTTIKHRPYVSALTALALGVGIAMLVRHRRS